MAPKLNRSPIESSSTKKARPNASPRAESHASAETGTKPATKRPGTKAAANAGSKKPSAKARTARLVDSKLAYKGKVFNVYKDTVIEPGGRENVREVIRHNGSVVILGVDETTHPADPQVILIRQYRHAAGQFLIELPAGRVDPGEAPLAAAKREMIEETGYRAKKWTLLVKYFASPGFLGEWMQIYLAEGIRPGEATPEEDEHIEILPTPLSEAMKLVAAGKIHDGKTLIGLSLYAASRASAHA